MGSEHINFLISQGSLTGDTYSKKCPIKGAIKEIILHFPSGCNALVEIKVFHGSKQILPYVGAIALDDATEKFSVFEPVNLGDHIVVDVLNHDSVNSHTVSIIIGVHPPDK